MVFRTKYKYPVPTTYPARLNESNIVAQSVRRAAQLALRSGLISGPNLLFICSSGRESRPIGSRLIERLIIMFCADSHPLSRLWLVTNALSSSNKEPWSPSNNKRWEVRKILKGNVSRLQAWRTGATTVQRWSLLIWTRYVWTTTTLRKPLPDGPIYNVYFVGGGGVTVIWPDIVIGHFDSACTSHKANSIKYLFAVVGGGLVVVDGIQTESKGVV